jgi:hypothetical protein
VHAVSLRYATSDAGWSAVDDICWWGDAAFAPHFLNLLAIPEVTATVTFAAEPVTEGDRATLGKQLRLAMASTFTPTHESPLATRDS